jgi:hypothetical protein
MGIAQVLRNYHVTVPPNNREYAWEEEASVFFKDLKTMFDLTTPYYFLGTIVLTEAASGILNVSDGQQRLATTTILLAAIRDYFIGRSDQEMANHVEQQYLSTFDPNTRRYEPRLKMNIQDNEFFRTRILSLPDSEERAKKPQFASHRFIAAAADLAAKHVQAILSNIDDTGKSALLNRWIEFLAEKAFVIKVVVPDELDAFTTFETLNARGAETSQADLVKNHLFKHAGSRSPEAYTRWGAMQASLESIEGKDTTITFLRYFLITRYGHLKAPDILLRVREKIQGEPAALTLLNGLADDANRYAAIQSHLHPYWNAYPSVTRKAIEALQQIDMKPMRPLLLSIARYFEGEEAAKAFRLLISWAVRAVIVGIHRSDSFAIPIANTSQRISAGEITSTEALTAAMSSVIPLDIDFIGAFSIANVSVDSLARYYLRTLELHRKRDPEPEFIPNESTVITLEHVIPQNPEKYWPKLSPEDADALYKRIGNMALLKATANSKLGNRPFATKVPEYRNSQYEYTRDIAKCSEWGKAEVETRQKRMADEAAKAWPLKIKG